MRPRPTCRAHPAHPPDRAARRFESRHPSRETGTGQPHTTTQVLAGDLAVLPNPQRRATRHVGDSLPVEGCRPSALGGERLSCVNCGRSQSITSLKRYRTCRPNLGVARARSLGRPLGRRLDRHPVAVGKFLASDPPVVCVLLHGGCFLVVRPQSDNTTVSPQRCTDRRKYCRRRNAARDVSGARHPLTLHHPTFSPLPPPISNPFPPHSSNSSRNSKPLPPFPLRISAHHRNCSAHLHKGARMVVAQQVRGSSGCEWVRRC